jgi:hypothetical protein
VLLRCLFGQVFKYFVAIRPNGVQGHDARRQKKKDFRPIRLLVQAYTPQLPVDAADGTPVVQVECGLPGPRCIGFCFQIGLQFLPLGKKQFADAGIGLFHGDGYHGRPCIHVHPEEYAFHARMVIDPFLFVAIKGHMLPHIDAEGSPKRNLALLGFFFGEHGCNEQLKMEN